MPTKQNDVNILMLGKIGHSEELVMQPVMEVLAAAKNVYVQRFGYDQTFYKPENFRTQVQNWSASVPSCQMLEWADVILCTDYWAPFLPLLMYKIFTAGLDLSNKQLVALYHGSTHMVGDVAEQIPHAANFDEYLCHCYDKIIVGSQHAASLLPDYARPVVKPYPIDFSVKPVNWRAAKRVIYAARWDYDKGKDRFIEFAKLAARENIECLATGSQALNGLYPNITFTGFMPLSRLKQLCSGGGYLWADARQEVFPYSVVNALFFGLTPLLADQPIYDVFGLPKRYRFADYNQMLDAILSGLTFTDDEWHDFVQLHAPNAHALATELAGVDLVFNQMLTFKSVRRSRHR